MSLSLITNSDLGLVISSSMLAIFLAINGVENYKKNGLKGWASYYFLMTIALFTFIIIKLVTLIIN